MTFKVAVIGAADVAYPRHEILIEGLRAQGADVTLFIQPKRTPTRQRWQYLWRIFPQLRDVDVVLLLAFNQTSVPLAWFLARRWGISLVVDYLVGLTDVVEDRASVNLWKQMIFRQLDRWQLAHVPMLTDTEAHRAYFTQLLGVQPLNMLTLPVGARRAFIDAQLPAPGDDVFVVQYVGTFIPFHGIETILDAAHRLRDNRRIHFELIGEGQMLAPMKAYAESLRLDNVRFITGYHRPPEVFELLQRAHLFLGVLGASPKTDYVVPTKIYELLALGRPLITAESQALQAQFDHDEHLVIVPTADATALTNAIIRLAGDVALREQLGKRAKAHIQTHYTPRVIGAQLLAYLQAFKD